MQDYFKVYFFEFILPFEKKIGGLYRRNNILGPSKREN